MPLSTVRSWYLEDLRKMNGDSRNQKISVALSDLLLPNATFTARHVVTVLQRSIVLYRENHIMHTYRGRETEGEGERGGGEILPKLAYCILSHPFDPGLILLSTKDRETQGNLPDGLGKEHIFLRDTLPFLLKNGRRIRSYEY